MTNIDNVFYITGASRGIGKSVAQLALCLPNSLVYGFSRNQSISNQNYIHRSVDLSNVKNLTDFSFPTKKEAKRAILFNNSGMLGQVRPFGNQSHESIIATHTLNAIAPAVLCNSFIKSYINSGTEMVIINISSGAARGPVESWGNYCASKASLDMLSQVIQLEHKKNNLRVFSVAPGIVDTKMQDEIREVSPKDFPHLNRFIDYKNNNQLTKTDQVANQLMLIAKHPDKYRDVILDVRKL